METYTCEKCNEVNQVNPKYPKNKVCYKCWKANKAEGNNFKAKAQDIATTLPDKFFDRPLRITVLTAAPADLAKDYNTFAEKNKIKFTQTHINQSSGNLIAVIYHE